MTPTGSCNRSSRSRPSPSSRPTTASLTASPPSARSAALVSRSVTASTRASSRARAFWPPALASAALPATATPTTAARSSTRNRTPGATRSTVLGICARPSVVACAKTPMPSRSGLPVAASGAGTPAATNTTAPRRFRPWSKRPRWSESPCGATAITTTPLPTIPFALAASS